MLAHYLAARGRVLEGEAVEKSVTVSATGRATGLDAARLGTTTKPLRCGTAALAADSGGPEATAAGAGVPCGSTSGIGSLAIGGAEPAGAAALATAKGAAGAGNPDKG